MTLYELARRDTLTRHSSSSVPCSCNKLPQIACPFSCIARQPRLSGASALQPNEDWLTFRITSPCKSQTRLMVVSVCFASVRYGSSPRVHVAATKDAQQHQEQTLHRTYRLIHNSRHDDDNRLDGVSSRLTKTCGICYGSCVRSPS